MHPHQECQSGAGADIHPSNASLLTTLLYPSLNLRFYFLKLQPFQVKSTQWPKLPQGTGSLLVKTTTMTYLCFVKQEKYIVE